MFGLTQKEHEARYAYADEWTRLLKQLWTGDGPRDFRGEYITAIDAFSDPHPLQDPYPVLMNAGTSGAGRAFAAEHSDLIFASLQDVETATRQIAEIKQLARQTHGREVRVFGRAHVVCRSSEEEARRYFRWVHRDQADVAAIERLFETSTANSNSIEIGPEEHWQKIERLAAGRGALTLVGTPEQIVSTMAELAGAWPGRPGPFLGQLRRRTPADGGRHPPPHGPSRAPHPMTPTQPAAATSRQTMSPHAISTSAMCRLRRDVRWFEAAGAGESRRRVPSVKVAWVAKEMSGEGRSGEQRMASNEWRGNGMSGGFR